MKKKVMSLLCTATLLIFLLLVPNVSANTGSNGKTILESGIIDNLSTYDTSVDWYAGSHYGKPSKNPSGAEPALWISNYFANHAVPQIKALFTDYWDKDEPMTKFLAPYNTAEFERSMVYNVSGGYSIGFSFFVSSQYTMDTLREIIFDSTGKGIQVWTSPDNGVHWIKQDGSSLFKFEIAKKLNPYLTYGDWPSQNGNFFDYIKNTGGSQKPDDLFYFLQVGCTVRLPDDTAMVKIVLPDINTLKKDMPNGWDENGYVNQSFLFGTVKANVDTTAQMSLEGDYLKVKLSNTKVYEQYQIWAFQRSISLFKISQGIGLLKTDYADVRTEWTGTAVDYLQADGSYKVLVKVKTDTYLRELTYVLHSNNTLSMAENLMVNENKIQSYYYTAINSVLSGLEPETSITDLKERLNNPSSKINVYNGETEVTSGNVTTGMTVKLTQSGVVTDSVKAAVTGDINGDGKITISDLINAKKILLNLPYSNERVAASDANNDGHNDIQDLVLYKKYLLGILFMIEAEKDILAEAYTVDVSDAIKGVLNVNSSNTVNSNLIGGGINLNFSENMYINLADGSGEWINPYSNNRTQHIPYGAGNPQVEEKLWADFLNTLDYTGSEYIRLGVSLTMWEPINDNSNPNITNFDNGFIFSPNFKSRPDAQNVPENTYLYMKAFYRLLDYFESKGKYVVIANWDRGKEEYCPNKDNWLAAVKPDNTKYGFSDRDVLGVTDINEYTESLAALMYHLKVEKNYNCVKSISFWNEPETLRNYEDVLFSVYSSLDASLKRLNIRNMVSITGYDGSVFWREETNAWNDNQISDLDVRLQAVGAKIDNISIHDYMSCLNSMQPTDLHGANGKMNDYLLNRLVKPALAQGAGKPVIFSEIGTFQYALYRGTTTRVEVSPKDYRLKLHDAAQVATLFNNGVKGYGLWTYNMPIQSHFTMLGYDTSDRYKLIPDNTNFYPSSLMMKYIKAGSNIVETTLTGCADAIAQRVYATVAKKDEETTILFVNDSENPANVTINGVDNKTYRQWFVDKDNTKRIRQGLDFDPSAKNNINLRPMSITVLTTYTYGTQTVR